MSEPRPRAAGPYDVRCVSGHARRGEPGRRAHARRLRRSKRYAAGLAGLLAIPLDRSGAERTGTVRTGDPAAERDRAGKPDGRRIRPDPLPRARAGAHLLEADRLPRFAGRTWRVSTDDHAGGDTGAVGACQKTELGTIGALDAVSRHYTAERGARAVQVVARFPDAKTAWRAHRVLVAWRDDCEQRVRDATVGPLRPVTVRSGRADSYLASYRSRAAGLGILRSGTLLTLVEVSAGREAYPSTWDPTRVAVRRIARTF